MNEADLKAVINLGGISALAATCRLVLSTDERSLLGFLGFFIPGIFAGMIAGWIVHSQGYSDQMNYAIVSASSLAAKELLLGIIKAAETLRDEAPSMVKRAIKRRFK